MIWDIACKEGTIGFIYLLDTSIYATRVTKKLFVRGYMIFSLKQLDFILGLNYITRSCTIRIRGQELYKYFWVNFVC